MRAYTVTTGVWARGILATEYGVDLSKVTWVLADEEHVEEYHRAYPANVVYQAGANLAQMVATVSSPRRSVLAGWILRTSNPSFPMPARQRRPGTRRRASIPSTTVVVKDALLQADPTLAPRLYNAFTEAKRRFYDN